MQIESYNSFCRWWGHLNTILSNQTCLNFLHWEVMGSKKKLHLGCPECFRHCPECLGHCPKCSGCSGQYSKCSGQCSKHSGCSRQCPKHSCIPSCSEHSQVLGMVPSAQNSVLNCKHLEFPAQCPQDFYSTVCPDFHLGRLQFAQALRQVKAVCLSAQEI